MDNASECCQCQLKLSADKLELCCGHSLCRPCSRLLKGFLNHRHVLEVLCPSCLNSIFSDISLVDVDNSEGEVVNCENCEKTIATVQCDTCGVNFCVECDRTIHLSKVMKKHERHRFAVAPSNSVPWKIDSKSMESPRSLCPTHAGAELSCFCRQCETVVCQLCIAESHSEHPHEPVQARLNAQREAMYKAFLDATHLLDRMEKTLSAIPDHIRSIGLDDSAIRGDTTALDSPSSSTPMKAAPVAFPTKQSREATLVTQLGRARKQVSTHFATVRGLLENRKTELLGVAQRMVRARYFGLVRQREELHDLKGRALLASERVWALLEAAEGRSGLGVGGDGVVDLHEQVSELQQQLKSVLEIDVLEQVGGIADSDVGFSYCSYLHEVIRCYGRVGAAEAWLLQTGDAFSAAESKEGGVSMGMSWVPLPAPNTSSTERRAAIGVGLLNDDARLSLCNLRDQVMSVINQAHSLDRRLDLVMSGLGYFPKEGEEVWDGTDDCSASSVAGTEREVGASGPVRLAAAFSAAASYSDPQPAPPPESPLTKHMRSMLPGPITGGMGVDGKSKDHLTAYQHLQQDIVNHFSLLSAFATKRVKTLLHEVNVYAARKVSYLEQQLATLSGMYISLYTNVLQALDMLQNDDSTFAGMVECGYFEQIQIDLAACVDPFLFNDIASRCDNRIDIVFAIDIASEIEAHGCVGGPPCPVDLHTVFDFGGQGSSVLLTWRPGSGGSSGTDTEVGSYEVQMAAYDFIESGPWRLLDGPRLPFQRVAVCSVEDRACLVPVKQFTACVLQFRLRAISSGGMAGAWSTVSSICTPRVFNHVFQFQSPFDRNGLLYWLGTGKGSKSVYENPHSTGEVTVTASTTQGSLHIFVSHDADSSFCITHNRVQSWICVDIGEGRYLEPAHYCLRSAKGETWKLRTWELHGRNSKLDKWTVLSKHRNCGDLAASSFSVGHWPIRFKPEAAAIKRMSSESSKEVMSPASSPGTVTFALSGMSASGAGEDAHTAFRYFRILQKGVNSSGDNFLVCNGIELYGMLHNEPVVL
jgi:hypothetical protein